MSEEQVIIKNTYLKFISPLSDLQDKRNEQNWVQGFFAITNKRILLIPEKNGKPAENETISITMQEISDVDQKITLWKKILGTAKILPIHHMKGNQEVLSLISTSQDQALLYKKILILLIVNGIQVEFVCPFSQGGKILLDKQPARGTLQLQENTLTLVSEWLGKKQNEIIELDKIDDFDTTITKNDHSSILLKYQKNKILISTLINSDYRTITLLDKYLKTIKGISDDIEEIQLSEQQYMLLQMMYTSDISGEMAIEMLGVPEQELEKIVRQLVQLEILKVSGNDEFELTEKGTKYIVEFMKKNLGG